MNADADLQVWLETSAAAQSSIIIPHVQSTVDQSLRYRITTTQESAAGRSSVGQSGTVDLKADQAQAISRLALSRHPDARCNITLILLTDNQPEKQYDFMCPTVE